MKISKKSHEVEASQAILAATDKGTIFYRIPLEAAVEALKKCKANAWLQYALEARGFDALNMKSNMFGSAVIDGVLYVCKTNGKDILVQGEAVDPETALKDFDVDDLSEYIEDPNDSIIAGCITEYEIIRFNFDKVAEDALKRGYKFTDLVAATNELDEKNI